MAASVIDFHAHLLPGLDDGVPTLDEAVGVARSLSEQGVRGVVVTPHVMLGGYHNPRQRILDALEDLRRSLHAEGIPLKLYPGSEVYLSPEIPQWYASGELLTLNDTGRYLLVELPYGEFPADTPWVIDELLRLGVRTVIAHPERNGTLVRRPALLAALLRQNALGQVNAGSLMGLYGLGTRRVARSFVRRGLVHLLGSDLHSAGRRSRLLPAAWEQFCRLVRHANWDLYCRELPEQVLLGEDARCPLPVDPLSVRLASTLKRFIGSRTHS